MVINEIRPGMTTFIPQQTHQTPCFRFTVRGPSRCLCFMQIEQTTLLSVLYKIMSKEITRKDILMLLPLSALSLADPITDILALIEFYSEGHKIWFAVGLIFLIAPCFMFSAMFCATGNSTIRCIFNSACLCGFHPFSAAVQRLEAFIRCSWKKLWHGQTIVEDSYEFEVLKNSKSSAWCEAVFESAPQFVIQLYVMNVQQEPVSIIQMISLPVSFVCLVWAFKAADEDDLKNIPVKYKILNFLTRSLLLSTRLFAITYFVVVYKWFIIAVLISHFITLWIMHRLYGTADSDDRSICEKVFNWYMLFGTSWVGYETFDKDGNETETAMKRLKIITVCSYIFLMLENCVMISLYYIPFKYLNPWYSLPLTVCVCLFSFLGAVLRFTIARKFVFDSAVLPLSVDHSVNYD